MSRKYIFEVEEEIECPECGGDVWIQSEVCPHCEVALL